MNVKNPLRLFLCIFLFVSGCTEQPTIEEHAEEEEVLARTEFTARVENFFEYSPLRAGQTSQFLIHLTDLSDGNPVEGAQVVLTVRPAGSVNPVLQTTAQVGRVTGIYVANVAIPNPGQYEIEFLISNAKLDERMPLTGFEVQ